MLNNNGVTPQQVCEHFTNIRRGGGQNRKVRHTGRPSGETGKELIAHLKCVAGSSMFPEEDLDPLLDFSQVSLRANLCCTICMVILDRPVQLSCGAVVCFHCCCTWIQLSCPCCYSHPLSTSTIQQPSSLLMSLLQDFLVWDCEKIVKLQDYQQHKCKGHYHQSLNSPSRLICCQGPQHHLQPQQKSASGPQIDGSQY